MYRNGTGTAPRPHCDGTVTCPPRHRHGTAIAPARHRTFCANGPFSVRWLTILPHRHWHGTRPQCDGSVTGPPRDRNGTATATQRHRHGMAMAPARHHTFCANEVFHVWLLTSVPLRHWHSTWIQAIGRMMANIAMISICPSSKQPGPQPLPPSAGGGAC